MNQINTTDNSLEVIENFLLLTATQSRLVTVKNILAVMDEFELETDIVSDMKELILQMEDTETISFEINKMLFDTAEEIISKYGIKIIISEITLVLLTNILITIIEVPKYNIMTYDTINSILMSEEDNIIKLNNLKT